MNAMPDGCRRSAPTVPACPTVSSPASNPSPASRLDDVNVHYNSSQPAQLNALAYTQGSDIHVAPGQEQHLPHEAWHVVQQAQGRVEPTMQLQDGVPLNDDEGLEHEADVMGAKALAPATQLAGGPEEEALPQGKSAPVQRTTSLQRRGEGIKR